MSWCYLQINENGKKHRLAGGVSPGLGDVVMEDAVSGILSVGPAVMAAAPGVVLEALGVGIVLQGCRWIRSGDGNKSIYVLRLRRISDIFSR